MDYALIKNGKVVNVIVADQEFIDSIQSEYDHIEAIDTIWEQQQGVWIDWSWDATNGFTAPPKDPEPVVDLGRKITKLAFMTRFTDAEAMAIDLASQGTTLSAAAMRRYQSKVNAATFIDLDRQDTRDGVIALESLGLLTAGRALQILDTPVLPEEVFKG